MKCFWSPCGDDLLMHLRSVVQYVQSLPSAQHVCFKWELTHQAPTRVHSQHYGPDSIFWWSWCWIILATLSSLFIRCSGLVPGRREIRKLKQKPWFLWLPDYTIESYVVGPIFFFRIEEKMTSQCKAADQNEENAPMALTILNSLRSKTQQLGLIVMVGLLFEKSML